LIRNLNDYALRANAPLKCRNTFRVPAYATWLAEVRTAAALPAVLARSEFRERPVVPLSGGSNVLITRDIDGLVLHLATCGADIVADEHGAARVRAAGGENWDRFVRWSISSGFCGLENLILIPGTVGAAPIQNIGAYGTELSEFVDAVEAWDCNAGAFVRLNNAACAFSYRSSIFKRNPHRYIVTAVEFLLPRERPLRLDYAGIREELRALGVATPTPATVGHAIERLRRRKLPDPAKIGNAGSFFKNPIIVRDRFDTLREAYPTLSAYPHGKNQCKL
jgi:UDP-N-acetylmuramate dehydrogenase